MLSLDILWTCLIKANITQAIQKATSTYNTGIQNYDNQTKINNDLGKKTGTYQWGYGFDRGWLLSTQHHVRIRGWLFFENFVDT